MALFSDDLFNVFEEESEPVSSKTKKRRRDDKEAAPVSGEIAKRPKVTETNSGLEDVESGWKGGGGKEGGLSAVIQGDGKGRKAEELEEMEDEWVESKWIASHTHARTHTDTHTHTLKRACLQLHTRTHASLYTYTTCPHRLEEAAVAVKATRVPVFSEPANIIAVETLDGIACTHEVTIAEY